MTYKVKADLVDRLRGIYRIPITDGLGPVGDSSPDEFIRQFETSPICNEAADAIELLVKVVQAFTEGHPFICGDAGEKDGMGLPDKLLVCPAYGLDGFAVYAKTEDYSAPGW